MLTDPHGALDLRRLLDALLQDRRLLPGDVLRVLEHSAMQPHRYPLELIAELMLLDASRPGQVLSLEQLGHWLAARAGQAWLDLAPLPADLAHLGERIPQAFAERHGIIALAEDAASVTVVSAQPFQNDWEADLTRCLGKPIRRVMASPTWIRTVQDTAARLASSVRAADAQQRAGLSELEHLLAQRVIETSHRADDAHTVHLVDWLLQYALDQRASDVHLEPRGEHGHLRYRVDGLLHPVYTFPGNVGLALTSRLKHLGGMDVAEKRRPQDGRLSTRLPTGQALDLRLSTLPTVFGEKLVLRLFDTEQAQVAFSDLGLAGDLLSQWQMLLCRRQGMLLVTGPTGSGKTSTLYASLRHLATPEVNLCTIEDPIERIDPALNQLQVQPGLDLTFAQGVRALLRQDPDVIMIGEIRDRETAQVAVQAALTGHLVLSTLHTPDACAAITRLQELGVADFLLKATLIGVMAQRLVRTLCGECKGTAAACRRCRGTGYHGRTGLFELLAPSEALLSLIGPHTDLSALRCQAALDGVCDLSRYGARQVEQGITTADEVRRVCG